MALSFWEKRLHDTRIRTWKHNDYSFYFAIYYGIRRLIFWLPIAVSFDEYDALVDTAYLLLLDTFLSNAICSFYTFLFYFLRTVPFTYIIQSQFVYLLALKKSLISFFHPCHVGETVLVRHVMSVHLNATIYLSTKSNYNKTVLKLLYVFLFYLYSIHLFSFVNTVLHIKLYLLITLGA